MNTLSQFEWSMYPSVLIGFGLWTLLYAWANRGRHTPLTQQVAFHLGTFIGLLALVSPLDELGDQYLFSAHMVQHLLLIFVTAPLWLIGTPPWLIEKIIPKTIERTVKLLVAPVSAFLVFTSTLWFWHIPAFYEMAQENELIHAFEHLCFISAGLTMWWPVAGRQTRQIPKPEAPMRMLYIFSLAIPSTSLAAVLTFAHTPLYPFYVTVPHLFGLDALQDQRLGGLLMWLPIHMVLLLAGGIIFFNWFSSPEKKENRISYRIKDVEVNKNLPPAKTPELGV
jgi:cytochrome c oxidase assembly factor CtaG